MKANSPNHPLREVFRRSIEDLSSLLSFSAAGVFIEDAGYLELVIARGELALPIGAKVAVVDAPGYQFLQKANRPLLQEERFDTGTIPCIFGQQALAGWMVIPFITHETIMGGVVFASNTGKFEQKDVHLAQTFIDQATLLLEKAQLADSLATEKRNIELLYELSQQLVATLDLKQVAERAVLLTTNALGVEFGEIMLIDPTNADRLHLFADVDYGELAVPNPKDYPFLTIGQGTAGWAAQRRTPIVAPDIEKEPSWISLPGVTDDVRSTAALPLIVHDELIGVLQLSSSIVGYFQPNMLPTLQAVAAPVAMALQNARHFATEQKRYQVAEALRLSTSTLILDLELTELLHKLLERLQQVVPFDSTSCFLLNGDVVQAVAALGLPKPDQVLNHSFPIDENVTQLMVSRKPIFQEDVSKQPWYVGWGGTTYVRGWMAVPLVHRGQFIGYISLDSRQPNAYGPPEAEVAQAFANQAATTIVNAQLLQESRRAAQDQWTVSQIVRELNATSLVNEILPAISSALHRLMYYDAVELVLFDEDEIEATAIRHTYQNGSFTEKQYTFLISQSSCAQQNLNGHIFQIDQDTGDEVGHLEREDKGSGFQAQLAIPLQVRQRIVGSLRVLWYTGSPPPAINGTTIAQVADAVAMTTEKNLLFSQTRRRIKEMETINQLATALRPLENQSSILNIGLSFVQKTFGCDVVQLGIVDQNDRLNLIAEVGQPTGSQHAMLYESSVFQHVWKTGKPYLSSNYAHDPLVTQSVHNNWSAKPTAAIFAPVFGGSTVIGVIAGYCLSEKHDVHSYEDLRLLTTIAGIIGTALHRSSVLETMEQRVAERTHQLAEANERLKELDRLKSEFIANVSHELRTPLTNIRFYIDLLRRGRVERHDEYLQTLEHETQQLNALIESVLDLSRINTARLHGLYFDVTSFDLSELLHTICQTYERQAQAKDVRLIYQDIAPALQIEADKSQINQVFATLLINAIAYTDLRGQVEVSAYLSHNNGVQITVRDTGIGILPHELPHIFERFFRGAQVIDRGIPGAGLGLSIAKDILDLHGGTIHIDSKDGEGTSVDIWLPQICPYSQLATKAHNVDPQIAIAQKAKETDDAT